MSLKKLFSDLINGWLFQFIFTFGQRIFFFHQICSIHSSHEWISIFLIPHLWHWSSFCFCKYLIQTFKLIKIYNILRNSRFLTDARILFIFLIIKVLHITFDILPCISFVYFRLLVVEFLSYKKFFDAVSHNRISF